MHPEKWYLVRLFKNSKVLFLLVLLFIFFQAYFNHKRIHTFPWFVWDMYSRTETVPETITQTAFYINGERLNMPELSIWEEATILHTFQRYYHWKTEGKSDPLQPVVESRTRFLPKKIRVWVAERILNTPDDMKGYPQWLYHYLTRIHHQPIRTLEIKRVPYSYINKQLKAENQPVTIFKIVQKKQ